MMVQIPTERGNVCVIAPECKYRPCLHIHWSRHGRDEKIAKGSGAKIVTFPLVCMRNEEYGCPHPLPDPETT